MRPPRLSPVRRGDRLQTCIAARHLRPKVTENPHESKFGGQFLAGRVRAPTTISTPAATACRGARRGGSLYYTRWCGAEQPRGASQGAENRENARPALPGGAA